MNGNKEKRFEDIDTPTGQLVGAGDFETVVENPYDIRAFLRFKHETGREWAALSEDERKEFLLPKYKNKV